MMSDLLKNLKLTKELKVLGCQARFLILLYFWTYVDEFKKRTNCRPTIIIIIIDHRSACTSQLY